MSIREATVICRQLQLGSAGFPFPASDLLLEGASLIQHTTNIAIFNCTGKELSISECVVNTTSGLGRSEFAAIQCVQTSNCEDGEMRLFPNISGQVREGRLEICYLGIWGSVYDPQWSGIDAAVTCQSLGFSGIAALPLASEYRMTDPAVLPIVYDIPQCAALQQDSILKCNRQGFQPSDAPRSPRGDNDVLSPMITITSDLQLENSTGSLGTLYIGILGSEALRNVVGVRCDAAAPIGQALLPSPVTCYSAVACNSIETWTANTSQECCTNLGPFGSQGLSYGSGLDACVRCESIRFEFCTSGDIRLIFREQSGRAGLLQICSRNVWSYVCPNLFTTFARVACRQLGFEDYENVLPRIISVLSPGVLVPEAPIISPPFSCQGTEEKFSQCGGFTGVPAACRINSLLIRLECPALPRVFLDPYLVSGRFNTDQGRRINLQCMYNSQDYPRPTRIIVSRNELPLHITSTNSIQIVQSNRTTVEDAGRYSCSVGSPAGSTTRFFRIVIIGGPVTGTDYLRLSSVSLQRQSQSTQLMNGQQAAYNEVLANMVSQAIPPSLPGQQKVTCTNVTRLSMDSEHNLDRFECIIITSGGKITSNKGAVVAQTAISFLQRALPGIFTDFEISKTGFCDIEETIHNNVTLVWPETEAGETIILPCPRATGNVTRQCMLSLMWGSPNTSLCEIAINIVDNALQIITLENYDELTSQVASAVVIATNDSSQQDIILLEDVANYFGNISALIGTESSTIFVPRQVIQSMALSISSLQQWSAQDFKTNAHSSRILLSLESIVGQYAQTILENETIVVANEDFTLVAENAPVSVLRQSGQTVTFENTALPSSVSSRRLADNQVASISLPPSMFERITDRTQVGIFFAVYNKSTLFPVREETSASSGTTGNSVVGSPVVAATVGPRLSFNNLQTPVQINLRLMVSQDSIIREGSHSCVSWDFNGASGNGNWSTAGCTTSVTCDGIVRCNCTHLTNFAVLVDICSRVDPGRCNNNEVFEEALSVLTIIGASLSIGGLVITVITLLAFKRLRVRDTTFYHVQLCVAVFFMLLVFVAGINKVSRVDGCVLVSFLIHYFTMAAIFWMTAEAALMVQKLVLVFKRVTKRIIVVTSIICWLTPLIFVVPPVIADLVNGRESSNDLVIDRKNFCFLKNAIVFWLTFLAPILLLVSCNTIVFGIVIAILIKHTRGTLTRKKETVKTKTVLRILVSTAGILFLFGISWIFAALTVTVPAISLPAQVLFVIFNSLQGFFIFLFFCVLSKESRESWKEVLSCGRYKSSFLNPSLKTGKNSRSDLNSYKNKALTSNYKTNNINSSSMNGKNDDTIAHSGLNDRRRGQDKVDLTKAQCSSHYGYSTSKQDSNKGDDSAEYSAVIKQGKEDLSVADPSSNSSTSIVLATEQGHSSNQVYHNPILLCGTTSSSTFDEEYVNTAELEIHNRSNIIKADISIKENEIGLS